MGVLSPYTSPDPSDGWSSRPEAKPCGDEWETRNQGESRDFRSSYDSDRNGSRPYNNNSNSFYPRGPSPSNNRYRSSAPRGYQGSDTRGGEYRRSDSGRWNTYSSSSTYQSRDKFADAGRYGDGGLSTERTPSSITEPTNSRSPGLQSSEFVGQDSVARINTLTPAEAESVRRDNAISIIHGDNVPPPMTKFEDFDFPACLGRALAGNNVINPSPIQMQSIPIVLSGRDFIGIAETGSGKTLAFLIPALMHLKDRRRKGPHPSILAIAPTRELVEQIKLQSEIYSTSMDVRVHAVYGGVPKKPQILRLRQGVDMLLACPGRLIDLLEGRATSLESVTYFILDEGDRMLDMGFEPQIRKIVTCLKAERQTLFFSATWPKEVQALARDLCHEDPVHVTIGSVHVKACNNVDQHVYVVQSESDKRRRLLDLLRQLLLEASAGPDKTREDSICRTLIFCETKKGADMLTRDLRQEGCQALSIHGDKEQNERKWVLEQFRTGESPILVATDVVARGLDIKNVKVVINYDMPNQIEDYVHRIGRTGRAGSFGTSYTLFMHEKMRIAKDLISVLRDGNSPVPKELEDLAHQARNDRSSSGRGRPYHNDFSRRGPYSGSSNFYNANNNNNWDFSKFSGANQ